MVCAIVLHFLKCLCFPSSTLDYHSATARVFFRTQSYHVRSIQTHCRVSTPFNDCDRTMHFVMCILISKQQCSLPFSSHLHPPSCSALPNSSKYIIGALYRFFPSHLVAQRTLLRRPPISSLPSTPSSGCRAALPLYSRCKLGRIPFCPFQHTSFCQRLSLIALPIKFSSFEFVAPATPTPQSCLCK